ncbi:MAG: tetratricopeptide repeat protein [Anaerolineae bacterium]
MDTRLARLSDRIAEAGWLAAAILTPLFFNIFSSRVFEPDKLTLLRSLALVMALAWLIGTIERGFGWVENNGTRGDAWWRRLLGTPLLPQVLLLVAITLLATVLSVTPHTSFWGSYQRLQGTYTFLCYVIVFAVAWQRLRTRAQLERLLNAIVLASLPVALYGVLQRYGLDPLPWAGSVRERVTGNLGNAIFIGAYLIMAFCVTLERAMARLRRVVGNAGTMADAAAAGCYVFVLGVQALAIFFCQSRGPWLGLLGGVYLFVYIGLVALGRSAARTRPFGWGDGLRALLFALLSPLLLALPVALGLAVQRVAPFGLLGLSLFSAAYIGLVLARRGHRWLWLSWFLQALLAVGFLVLLTLPQSIVAPLREVPGIGRLGHVFETEGGTGRVRVLIWEGSVQMIGADAGRALVGYGPEAMYVAFNPFYPPDLAHYESRNASPDRAHNETFDALITTGLLGFVVYMALFVGIFYQALVWLGFLPPPGPDKRAWQRTLFLVLTLGCAALGAFIPLTVDRSLRFAGVGVPVGLIVGVVLYLAAAAFATESCPVEFGERELLLTGLLAMVLAHFVEIHFGIAIAATRTHFWLGLALLLGLGTRSLALEKPTTPAFRAPAPMRKRRGTRVVQTETQPARPTSLSARRAGLLSGVLTAVLTCTLVYDLSTAAEPASLAVLLKGALSLALLLQLALTAALGLLFLLVEAEDAPGPRPAAWWVRAIAWHLAAVGTVTLAYLVFHLLLIGSAGARDATFVIYYYFALVLALLLLWAALQPSTGAHAGRWRGGIAWAYPLVLAVVAVLVNGNISVVRADIYYKQAWDGFHRPAYEALATRRIDIATAQRSYDIATYFYEKALAAAPQEDYYLLFLGKAYLERGQITEDVDLRDRLFAAAEETLLHARTLNPLNTDHTANLARLYRTRAEFVQDAAARADLMARSLREYQAALRLSPHNVTLHNELARALQDNNQPEEALDRLQQSLRLDSQYAPTYLLLGELLAKQHRLEEARTAYEQGLQLDADSVPLHSGLGYVYSQLGLTAQAISHNLRVLELLPGDYVAAKNLALLFRDSGQLERALDMARLARQRAPETDRTPLDQLIASLEAASSVEAGP